MLNWLFLNDDDHTDLRHARSRAELIRTRNSTILLFVGVSQFCVNCLVALRVFHLI